MPLALAAAALAAATVSSPPLTSSVTSATLTSSVATAPIATAYPTQVEIIVPRGAGLYCTVELLALMHAHGANGRSISVVIEVSRPMPEGASSAEIDAASKAQPELPLQEHLGDWAAAVDSFKGPKLKGCWCCGGGSTRRVVMASLRGLKQGRGKRRLGMSRKEARAAIAKMTDEELEAAAAAWMRFIGAPAGACAAAVPVTRAAAHVALALTSNPNSNPCSNPNPNPNPFHLLQASSSCRRSCRRRWMRSSRRACTCARTRRRCRRASRSPPSRPRVRPPAGAHCRACHPCCRPRRPNPNPNPNPLSTTVLH